MEKFTARRKVYMVALAVAVACIAAGVYNVWRSFERFDNSIMTEKDTQFYSLMRSDDINLENSISAFERETESFMNRERFKNAVRAWKTDGDSSAIWPVLKDNPLQSDPVYADVLILNKGKVFRSASGNKSYEFLTGKDANSMRLCRNNDGAYFLAYENDVRGKASCAALIDITKLYSTAIGKDPERGVMLLDNSSTIMISGSADGVKVEPAAGGAGADEEKENDSCREYLVRCQKDDISDGISLEMTDEKGEKYTARMVAMPSSSTVNGEFAIGMTANYEEAIEPSRKAAEEILIFGALAITGVIGLLLLLALMRRENAASSAELRALKKKNEAMEEINQKMQALTHHQRLETIGTMTASIAHDFNNLLTPIMGYSIMTMEMLPADATDLQENLMEVYNASVKAKDIVTRLADLTKKGNEHDYKEIKVDEVIYSALKVTLPAKPKNVEVKANFGAKDVEIRADRTQISQLVMNIVLNAYDAMRDEGGEIRVSTRRTGDEVIIKFKDTGCGMDAETVSRIFDPFYTTKESGKGTGLGLAIVAQIIETHGGRIYVESEPGEGTEFRIYLPCADADISSLAWGPGGEGKYDTKRYNTSVFRKALAEAEAKKEKLEE